jgi:hypothetical protein
MSSHERAGSKLIKGAFQVGHLEASMISRWKIKVHTHTHTQHIYTFVLIAGNDVLPQVP